MAKFVKWMALGLLAGVVVGCGGDGNDGATTGGSTDGGGSGITRSYPSFSLPRNGMIQVTFLTGQDRITRAPGSQVALIDEVELLNGVDDRVPATNDPAFEFLNVVLDEFQSYMRLIPVRFDNANVSSREFTEYPFRVRRLQIVQPDGTLSDLPAPGDPAVVSAQPFDISIRAIPGRYTALQVYLDDEILRYSDTEGLVFDEDKFTLLNYDPRVDAIRGVFSDYLAFDLSAMSGADRPQLSTGQSADRVFFSGDGIGVSRGTGSTSEFELLDPVLIRSGTVNLGPIINGQRANNSYTLNDRTPGNLQVTALTGIWKESKDVVNPTDGATAIALPNASESDSQQLVIYSQDSSGKVVAMWQGQIDYVTDADGVVTGNFAVWPVSTVDTALPNPGERVAGTITNVQLRDGVPVRGDWDVTETQGAWPFPTGGGFSVYRG